MYGIQTLQILLMPVGEFENVVNMYGIQTFTLEPVPDQAFENDVNMYGIQTFRRRDCYRKSLRMM